MPVSESPLILSIETATRTGSVALARGTQLLALRAGEAQVSHSTKLLQRIAEVLAEAGASLQEVELFAVASGPGSFTGLRIGLATVKSFAATLQRSCVGFSTLAAVAHAAGPSQHTLAMIPAGRGEVFAQLHSVDDAGEVTPLSRAIHQQPEQLLDSLVNINQLRLAGEGAQQHELLIREKTEREGISLRDDQTTVPDTLIDRRWSIAPQNDSLAANISALAYLCYRKGETVGPEQLKAIYVRPSDAELNSQEQ